MCLTDTIYIHKLTCTNFYKLANVQRHYMEGSCTTNYTPISQEICQLQEQIH